VHEGRFFELGPVVFEPKPLQSPLPLHVGGDSQAALRRAVRCAEGWLGMVHDPGTFTRSVDELRRLAEGQRRDLVTLQRTAIVADPDDTARAKWAAAGATRLIVAPWERTSGALSGLRRFAEQSGIA
jgi:alkanesulfonate monooxygenase SsuD/methylene tetrahydromethanopterin reductase-like flavin-dependent oxidoreductase (luciferase family)